MPTRKRGRASSSSSSSSSGRQSKSARGSGGGDRRRHDRAEQQEKDKAARQQEKSHKLAAQQRAQQQLLMEEQQRLHAEAVAAHEQFQHGKDPFPNLAKAGGIGGVVGARGRRGEGARRGSAASSAAHVVATASRGLAGTGRLRDVPEELLSDVGDLATDSNNLVLYQNSLRVIAQSLPYYLQLKNGAPGSGRGGGASNMLHGGHVLDGAKLAEDTSQKDRKLMEMINMGPTSVELPQGVYRRAFQSIVGAHQQACCVGEAGRD